MEVATTMSEDYRSTILQMKQQAAARQQDQLVREATAVYEEVRATEEAAAEALAAGDTDTANYYVEQLTEKEKDLAYYAQQLPPPPPQVDPRLAEFARRNQSFLQRYGQRAYQALDAAHQYMMRPRNPNSNDPRYTGMGFRPEHAFTPQYFKRLKDLLEMHGEQLFGVKYDRAEQALTANQACKISNLSPQHYNHAVRAMAAQGRLGQKK
jgi:ATP/maltotriose-dependent transcriptional regulator MalT